MIIDGIEFRPVRKHQIVIPNYYVSKCAKVWNDKTKKYLKCYRNFRNNKSVDKKPKCLEFSIMTEGKPFWSKGCKYKPKKNAPTRIEFKIKLHLAVKDAWDPYEDYLDTLSREELILLALENMMVDHDNDIPEDNHLSNLVYSTPLKNSHHRKKWI